jgi:hypothetical protein
MNRASRLALCVWLCLVWIIAAGVCPSLAGDKAKVLVGRVSHVEGQLLRYVYEEKDWVAIGREAPFGLEDALYTDSDGRGELMLPNNIWIRVGGSTQIQLVKLKPDLTEVDVAAGMARLHNRSGEGVIKVTSPFGYVVAYGDTVFDIYVGDESVEVIGITGTVEFVHGADESRYEVVAGSTSVVADAKQIVAEDGYVDGDWDDWNLGRDDLWTKRVEVKGDSIEYLPANLSDDAYALEENGRWEKVYHEGEYRTLWKPTRVSAGWAPYTVGRWSVYYGDNCWIPDEPFGYVTHHYGSWVRVDSCNCWYWSPPKVRRVATRVSRDWYEDYEWCPGRVGWVHRDNYVGWVPLAPTEPYYSNRYWGATSVVVSTVPQVNINIGGYRYLDDAVIVNHDHLYGVNNYSAVRVTNINKTTIVNNYHSAPVVNNTVINNYNTISQRYQTTNVMVSRAPHDSVVRRIEHNQRFSRETASMGAVDIERSLSRTREGRIAREGRIGRPEVTNRLVDRGERSKPDSEVQFGGRRNLVRNARQIQDAPGGSGTHRDNRAAGSGRGLRGEAGPDAAAGLERQGRERPSRLGRTQGEGQSVTDSPSGLHERDRRLRPGRDGEMAGADAAGREAGDPRLRPVRPGRDRGVEAAGSVEDGAGGRDRLRPVRPGRDGETAGADAAGREAGDPRLRPVRPGRDRGVEAAGSVEDGAGGRDRLRPVRPGRDGETAGADAAGREAGDPRLRPVRPGRDRGVEAAGSVEDGAGGRDRLRPVRPGRDGETAGADAAGREAGDPRLRPVRPGRDRGADPGAQVESAGNERSLRSPRERTGDSANGARSGAPDSSAAGHGMRGAAQAGSAQPAELSGRPRGVPQAENPRQAQDQRRQQMDQQRAQQQQQRQQQMEQQRSAQQQQQQQAQDQRRQQMEQQRAQQQQQRQQQMEQQRSAQQQQQQQAQDQRRQQMEQQRAQQQQQRQQQMEQQRSAQQQQQQQAQDQRRQQMEQQRAQQQQQRQQQMEQQRSAQQQQQQRQTQGQQRLRPGQDPNDPSLQVR